MGQQQPTITHSVDLILYFANSQQQMHNQRNSQDLRIVAWPLSSRRQLRPQLKQRNVSAAAAAAACAPRLIAGERRHKRLLTKRPRSTVCLATCSDRRITTHAVIYLTSLLARLRQKYQLLSLNLTLQMTDGQIDQARNLTCALALATDDDKFSQPIYH